MRFYLLIFAWSFSPFSQSLFFIFLTQPFSFSCDQIQVFSGIWEGWEYLESSLSSSVSRVTFESVLWLQFISIMAKNVASKSVLSFLNLVVGIIFYQADKWKHRDVYVPSPRLKLLLWPSPLSLSFTLSLSFSHLPQGRRKEVWREGGGCSSWHHPYLSSKPSKDDSYPGIVGTAPGWGEMR